MDTQTQEVIVAAVLDALIDAVPDAACRTMYGGTVFEIRHGDANSRFGGVFVSKSHVSLEFTRGVDLTDHGNFLEGTGKRRRHIKLFEVDDITTKNCRRYLIAAAGFVA